jgi:alanine racemase
VVKADAYGHGAVRVARRLEEEGADRFAVAISEEGLQLRRAGVRGEILILNFSDPADAPLHRAYGLTPALFELEHLRAFAEAARFLPEPLPVHLKIDTGMGRLGILPADLPAAIQLLRQAERLALRGTFTQLARAEEEEHAATDAQIETMKRCLGMMQDAGIDPGLVHLANSAGVLAHPASIFDAVRPGLALYGILPSEFLDPAPLKPSLVLETRVMAVKRVPPGTPLGYGGRFVTRRPSTIATLPIGYHDGVRRSFSDRVPVLLRGEKAPIVGVVSMDLTLVDATDSGARPGDRVVLLGSQGKLQVTAWDLARAADTIPYEIVCAIGARVPRVYV